MSFFTAVIPARLIHAQDNLAVFAVDGATAYTGGGNGINALSLGHTISKTTDGGHTWRQLDIGARNSINSLYFLNADTGWAVGWNPVYRTVDGGAHWDSINPGSGEFYYSVRFVSADTGWIAGNNTLSKTVDGGRAWMPQNISGCCDSGYTLFSLDFTDARTGYAVGNSYVGIDLGHYQAPVGVILKTADGGGSWNAQADGLRHTVNALSFGATDTGWAVGDSGLILRTVDGGAQWNDLSADVGASANLHAVCFKGTRRGWIVGDSGFILNTADGGAHWTARRGPTAAILRSISLSSPDAGWIAGDSGTLLRIDGNTLSLRSPRADEGSRLLDPTPEGWSYRVPARMRVQAALYGLDGGLERKLLDAEQEAGEHRLALPHPLAPGIHLLELRLEGARRISIFTTPME